MRRRSVLAAAVGVSLSGCLSVFGGDDGSPTPTASERPSPTPTATESPTPSDTPTDTDSSTPTDAEPETDDPTATPLCPGDGGRRVPFGTTVRFDGWAVTIQSLEFTQTYRLEDEPGTQRTADGEQLVIVEGEITNDTADERTWWFDSGVTLILPGCVTDDYQFRPRIGTGDYYDRVRAVKLERVGHLDQFLPEVGYELDARETGPLWNVATIDADLERSDLEIGVNYGPDVESTRWVPELSG
ncbi:hypothetical protein RYH80_07655 [Halobaculum sp. MBLA0147]|uniref:hypothetical protein n=1 Tax=Halobaculum sp. MBLA0147 TaxID=3079934 RepID=UPI00352346C9